MLAGEAALGNAVSITAAVSRCAPHPWRPNGQLGLITNNPQFRGINSLGCTWSTPKHVVRRPLRIIALGKASTNKADAGRSSDGAGDVQKPKGQDPAVYTISFSGGVVKQGLDEVFDEDVADEGDELAEEGDVRAQASASAASAGKGRGLARDAAVTAPAPAQDDEDWWRKPGQAAAAATARVKQVVDDEEDDDVLYDDDGSIIDVDGDDEEAEGTGSSDAWDDDWATSGISEWVKEPVGAVPGQEVLPDGVEDTRERAYLVGIELKSGKTPGDAVGFGINDSLAELALLADTAGLVVAGSTYQRLERVNPRYYIGSGKVEELSAAVKALGVDTILFDDELSPGQLRNLEKALGGRARVGDRTALILDIFSQRARTSEGMLQVELAQMEYQLPRLTRMWTHLERQAGGGLTKGMGEKQIEVDKRIIKERVQALKRELDRVRSHRSQHRERRAAMHMPVFALVGYTNAGKSTLMNVLSPHADVFAEDKLFATLDPTTRRVPLPGGYDCLLTDTVGFIQKLPTQLVAAFRATLEEIGDSSMVMHVVDVAHPMAIAQTSAVEQVLDELGVLGRIPMLTVWNKVGNRVGCIPILTVWNKGGGCPHSLWNRKVGNRVGCIPMLTVWNTVQCAVIATLLYLKM
eukprot:jgi/Mesvir1/6866/Mv09035-RA.3